MKPSRGTSPKIFWTDYIKSDKNNTIMSKKVSNKQCSICFSDIVSDEYNNHYDQCLSEQKNLLKSFNKNTEKLNV